MAVRRSLLALGSLLLVMMGLIAPAAAQQGNPSFNLVNRGQVVIRELYANPASVNVWGPDRLGADVVQPGQTYPVRLPFGECLYDIRVVYANGQSEELRRVDLCQLTDVAFPRGAAQGPAPGPGGPTGPGVQPGPGGPPPAAGGPAQGDPSFRVVNRSGQVIREVYASPVTDNTWGQDRLGADVVPANGTYIIRLPRGPCQWDVRVVYASGQAEERRNINLCAITDLPFP
jgi:hypothetical protein